ncbi:MAG: YggS family pyridoxal phosphate-dependent enzyme [Pirellulaceae bacterium]
MNNTVRNIEILRQNLESLENDVQRACDVVGRERTEVKVVAVTKYHGVKLNRDLIAAGHHCFGENRPDQFREKCEAIESSQVEWHFIGHLQRNKIRWVIPHAHLIHSVDSQRLLSAISRHAVEAQQVVNCLLEVNISGEANKDGMSADNVRNILDNQAQFPNIRFDGLMGMGGLSSSDIELANEFSSLEQLLTELQHHRSSSVPWNQLSMGMSDDFPIAIAQGATLIRVGSRLLEGVQYGT